MRPPGTSTDQPTPVRASQPTVGGGQRGTPAAHSLGRQAQEPGLGPRRGRGLWGRGCRGGLVDRAPLAKAVLNTFTSSLAVPNWGVPWASSGADDGGCGAWWWFSWHSPAAVGFSSVRRQSTVDDASASELVGERTGLGRVRLGPAGTEVMPRTNVLDILTRPAPFDQLARSHPLGRLILHCEMEQHST